MPEEKRLETRDIRFMASQATNGGWDSDVELGNIHDEKMIKEDETLKKTKKKSNKKSRHNHQKKKSVLSEQRMSVDDDVLRELQAPPVASLDLNKLEPRQSIEEEEIPSPSPVPPTPFEKYSETDREIFFK